MKKKPYLVRLASHGARLPKYISFFEDKLAQVDTKLREIEDLQKEMRARSDSLDLSVSQISDRLDAVTHQLSTLDSKGISHDGVVINNTVSDNHAFDHFYKKFEDTFRGTEEEISARVQEHLPLFHALPPSLRKLPFVDIGCGRGEVLALLRKNGFSAIGIDMNIAMVQRATNLGFEAYAIDALSYLRALPSNSLAAVTGFHIAEHIPFESLIPIIQECHRVLAKGGLLLLETPNPQSLSVGAHTFYLDPSHQRPVPPLLLDFMVQYGGFSTKIIPLHQIKIPPKNLSRSQREMYEAIFGYADYAVIGNKKH